MARREDFDNFERQLKRRRMLAPVVTALALLAAAVGGWRAYDAHRSATPGVTEVEPNNLPKDATRMALGAPMRGSIGATEDGTNDRDLYVLEVPQGSLSIRLSAVEDLNLTLDVLQLEPKPGGGEELVRRVFLDDRGPSEPERLDGFFARKGPLYLRVEEAPFVTEPRNRTRRERARYFYTLEVNTLEGKRLEEEPNDSPATAQNCPLTEAVTAWAGARLPAIDAAERSDAPFSSPDFFQVEVKGETDKVAVLVAPEKGCKLQVVDSVAYEAWQARRAAATSPSGRVGPQPEGLEVDGQPGLKVLSAAGGRRRVRVTTVSCEPGTRYLLAFVSGDATGAVDLADRLERDGRPEAKKRALELTANEFSGADLKAKR